MRNNKKGFTLVELLVVIAIIGLLATLAVVAMNSARQKARDAKRISDIKQIQTALELYFNDNGGYPDGTGLTLGPSDQDSGQTYEDCPAGTTGDPCDHLCSGGTTAQNGFLGAACAVETVMAIVPGDVNPGASSTSCGATGGAGCTYEYTSATDSTYTVVFELEGTVGDMNGTCTATQSGITCV